MRSFLRALNFSVEAMAGHFAIKIVVEQSLVTGTVVEGAEVLALRNMLEIYVNFKYLVQGGNYSKWGLPKLFE